LACKKQAKQ